jgi:Tfp pilus assembly protein PilX
MFLTIRKRARAWYPPQNRQRGAILVVGLIMLVTVVILGLAAMRAVVLQERLAGGFAAQNLALQSSETALRAAERIIQGGGAPKEEVLKDHAPGWFSIRGTDTALPASPRPDETKFWSESALTKKLSQEARAESGTPSILATNPIVDYYGVDATDGFARFAAERQEDVSVNSADVSIGKGVPTTTPLWRIYSYGRGFTPSIWVGLQSEYKPK